MPDIPYFYTRLISGSPIKTAGRLNLIKTLKSINRKQNVLEDVPNKVKDFLVFQINLTVYQH